MTKVLLDTNIIIDYLRGALGPLPQLVDLQEEGKGELYLSSLTIMEIYAGLSSTKMEKELQLLFDTCTVVPFDALVARFAGELKRDKKFRTVPVADYLIGSTALWLKAQLATRNKKHFQGIPGLKFFKLPQ